MKILRIFPRKTKGTPLDKDVIINRSPGFFDEADEIHISVAFTWDLSLADRLYKEWKHVATTKIGGCAFNEPQYDFVSGMYLKEGYTITSRGCNNRCWFCSVWKRQPNVIELPIVNGNIIQDDNLLACSDQHIKDVFKMLSKQKKPAVFSGGIEAKLLKPWHIDLFNSIRLKSLFCAYDTPDDLDPLIEAGRLLKKVNITFENRKAVCYVLIGYPKDTFEKAEKRIEQVFKAGFFPFAMLWRNDKGSTVKEWRQFQRQWANPIITSVNCKRFIKD